MGGSHAAFLAEVFSSPADTEADPLASRILDAAFDQFRAHGVRRSSMEDVARRADVGRVTIYRRFATKDRLVQALLLRECRKMISDVDERTQHLKDVEARLIESFLAAVRISRRHPLILGLLAAEPEDVLPLLTLKADLGLALGREYVAHQLRRARKELSLSESDTDQVAEVMARLILSLVLTPHSCLPLEDESRFRKFARKHLLPLMVGTTARR